MDIQKTRYHNKKKLFIGTKDNKPYTIEVETNKLIESELDHLLSTEGELVLVNDIHRKYLVPKQSRFNVKVHDKVGVSGHKYLKECYEDHINKEFVYYTSSTTPLYTNDHFSIYKIENEEYLTIFSDKKSFREINCSKIVKEALQKTLETTGWAQSECVNYFHYDGIRTNLYFRTRNLNISVYFTDFLIFIQEYIKNIDLDPEYYKKDIGYVQDIY